MKCDQCGGRRMYGIVNDGVFFCDDCVATWHAEETPLDTPNLEDSNPEMWGYMNNRNPWGMEGGY